MFVLRKCPQGRRKNNDQNTDKSLEKIWPIRAF